MVALREEWSDERRTPQDATPESLGARWMRLRHASCRLDVSATTLRRRIRNGELPWRVVEHGRWWAYEVLVPDSAPPCGAGSEAISIDAYLGRQVEEKDRQIERLKAEIRGQEQEIENLSQALVRARSRGPYTADSSPFARYRQLVVPRRRWWFFRSPYS